ncbi:hypothetical protein AYO38_09180 [bacterium SCGC AG-212-C10]|nr:hypothetical protein AYO38_09180 [bacterium SCGC AG-212-C10]
MTSVQTFARKQATTGTMAALFVFLALFAGVTVVSAQAPPAPPARFVGTVSVNGAPAAAGTVIEARVGGASCGTTTVFMNGSEARYSIDVKGADTASAPGCGTDGAAISFIVGGATAAQSGTWRNFDLNTLNLTAGGAAATPTTVAATPTTPAGATATATTGGGTQPTRAATAPVVATPRAPSTGNTTSGGSDGNAIAWLAVGTLTVLLVAGAATAIRQR